MLAAALAALAEIGAGLLIGQHIARGRADTLVFLAFRPVILAMLMLATMRWRASRRLICVALAIGLAISGEGLLILVAGNAPPIVEQARGAFGAASLVALIELLLRGLDRAVSRVAVPIAGLLLSAALLIPTSPIQHAYSIIVGGEAREEPSRAEGSVKLLTGLPLVWGEHDFGIAGVDSGDGGSSLLAYLRRSTAPIGIDRMEDGLNDRAVLFIAQPRPLAPADLVALDAWVRRGGHALVLADPHLLWPSRYPLGHPLRPPTMVALEPWLAHLGLAVAAQGDVLAMRDVAWRERRYRLQLAGPGAIAATGREGCSLAGGGLVADCRPGWGRVVVIADADLLHPLLWRGPGERGEDADRRTSDNAAFVADLLAELDGRAPRSATVHWIADPSRLPIAVAAAFLPPLLMLATAFFMRDRMI